MLTTRCMIGQPSCRAQTTSPTCTDAASESPRTRASPWCRAGSMLVPLAFAASSPMACMPKSSANQARAVTTVSEALITKTRRASLGTREAVVVGIVGSKSSEASLLPEAAGIPYPLTDQNGTQDSMYQASLGLHASVSPAAGHISAS